MSAMNLQKGGGGEGRPKAISRAAVANLMAGDGFASPWGWRLQMKSEGPPHQGGQQILGWMVA